MDFIKKNWVVILLTLLVITIIIVLYNMEQNTFSNFKEMCPPKWLWESGYGFPPPKWPYTQAVEPGCKANIDDWLYKQYGWDTMSEKFTESNKRKDKSLQEQFGVDLTKNPVDTMWSNLNMTSKNSWSDPVTDNIITHG